MLDVLVAIKPVEVTQLVQHVQAVHQDVLQVVKELAAADAQAAVEVAVKLDALLVVKEIVKAAPEDVAQVLQLLLLLVLALENALELVIADVEIAATLNVLDAKTDVKVHVAADVVVTVLIAAVHLVVVNLINKKKGTYN